MFEIVGFSNLSYVNTAKENECGFLTLLVLVHSRTLYLLSVALNVNKSPWFMFLIFCIKWVSLCIAGNA